MKRILFIVGLYILLKNVSQLPYVNLFLTTPVTLSIIWITISALWKVRAGVHFFTAIVLCVAAFVSVVAGNSVLAEKLGNGIYFLVWLGTLDFILWKNYPI